ncbi:MAG TPA: hypothetical protein VHN14_16205 [Kofleriaceae bacterium]|nr:hypothetical protein [Kofleriaceae bacterium]
MHICKADVARELRAEHSPVICEERGRQHGDREATTRYATLDLGDQRCPKPQIIREQYPGQRQVERREQVSTHEFIAVNGMEDEQVEFARRWGQRCSPRVLGNYVCLRFHPHPGTKAAGSVSRISGHPEPTDDVGNTLVILAQPKDRVDRLGKSSGIDTP